MSLIGNVLAGYRLAWRHRRPLAAVLLPILSVAALAGLLIGLLTARDRAVVLDGVLRFSGDDAGNGGGASAWLWLVLVLTSWLLALSAGGLTVAGAERGHPVPPGTAMRFAVGRLPIVLFGAVLFGAAVLLTLRVLADSGSIVPVVAVLVLATLVAARLLLGMIWLGRVPAWQMTRGRAVPTAGAFLVGGMIVPLLLTRPAGAVVTEVPLVSPALGALLVAVVVAVQAGIIAHVHLLCADQEAVEARLTAYAGGPPRRVWPVAGAAVAVLLLPSGLAAVVPLGVPVVRTHESLGFVPVAAWPGEHPVLVTDTGVRFCETDLCDRYEARNGGPSVSMGGGVAGISADGTAIVRAVVTGGEGNGGPFIHFGHCTRDGCTEAWVPARASAREPYSVPELGAAIAPDGVPWFALAVPADLAAPGGAFRITLLRCPAVSCAEPQRFAAGEVEVVPDDGNEEGPRVRLSVGADGRPSATVRNGSTGATVVTCSTATCADTTVEPGPITPETDVYRAEAERASAPGVVIRFGESEESGWFRQTLLSCPGGVDCRRIPLDVFEGPIGNETLAVSRDGRVLIVRQDRMLLVSDQSRPAALSIR